MTVQDLVEGVSFLNQPVILVQSSQELIIGCLQFIVVSTGFVFLPPLVVGFQLKHPIVDCQQILVEAQSNVIQLAKLLFMARQKKGSRLEFFKHLFGVVGCEALEVLQVHGTLGLWDGLSDIGKDSAEWETGSFCGVLAVVVFSCGDFLEEVVEQIDHVFSEAKIWNVIAYVSHVITEGQVLHLVFIVTSSDCFFN